MASLDDLLFDIRRVADNRAILTDKKIEKMHEQLSKGLKSFISEGFEKYADADGRFYMSYLDANNKRAWFLNEIIENVDNFEPELKKELLSLVNDTYDTSYKGMVDAFKKAEINGDVSRVIKDIKVQPDILKQALNNNISKLTLPRVLEKHRAELIYQIQQELNIGLMQGDRFERMAKRISERVKVSQSKAMNIVRTESHRNVESGFMDCAERIQESMEGSDYIYAATWKTAKDERVRPQRMYKTKKGWKKGKNSGGANHMIMEGVTVKVGEMFDLKDGNKDRKSVV